MAWISELEESKEEAREEAREEVRKAERGNGNQYAEGQYANI